MRKWLLILALTLWPLGGLNSKTNLRDIIDIGGKLLPIVIPDDKIGALFKNAVDQHYGVVQNSPDLTRIQQIGGRLLPLVKNRKTKYDFAILSSNEFNACSIYGGHIRINQGLLRHIGPADNELAFILAHEISHQDLGHNYKVVQQFRLNAAAQLVDLDKKMPLLMKMGVSAALADRSRQFEREADRRALEMIQQSGFKLTGAIAAFRRIEAEYRQRSRGSGENPFSRIFDSHPAPAKRVEAAEDYLFSQKYGRTFKADDINNYINRATTAKPFGGAVMIVAHPSLWETPLRVTTDISGVGLFNQSPFAKEEKDVAYYLDLLRAGQMVAACGDNDSHELDTFGHLKNCYTFINNAENNPTMLLEAIKSGRTYASADGAQITNQNFIIGQDYPMVKKAIFNFEVVFPHIMLYLPRLKIFRNGELVAETEANAYGDNATKAFYVWQDTTAQLAQRYWYVLYIPGQIITSPITVKVTRLAKTANLAQPDWQKTIIHCHSRYSDGRGDLEAIHRDAARQEVQTIFMTDHDDCFHKHLGHFLMPHKQHRHRLSNPYSAFAAACRQFNFPHIIPGFEYTFPQINQKIPIPFDESKRHLLILNQDTLPEPNQTEEALFGQPANNKGRNSIMIMAGPYHLGDDIPGSEIHKDRVFALNLPDLQNRAAAYLKIRVKGTPRKDPIIWINRQEIGRIVTSDDQWREYQFGVNLALLRAGDNLFHIQAYIPDLWQTFDDCEFAQVKLIFQ